MQTVSPRIADIQHLVTIPRSPAASPAARVQKSAWNRTVSAPVSFTVSSRPPREPLDSPTITDKPFSRSKTGAVDTEKGLEIYLGHNLLQSQVYPLPS